MVDVMGESGVDLRGIDETPSTVYVPRRLLGAVDDLMEMKGLDGLRGVLGLVLGHYEMALGEGVVRQSERGKKLYQRQGLDLVKRNFHPTNGDWATLTAHAHTLGYARNLLFVKLLSFVLEREGLLKPGLPRKPLAKAEGRVRSFKRVCYVEILEFGRFLRRKFAHTHEGGP